MKRSICEKVLAPGAFCGSFLSFHGYQQFYYVLGIGINVSQMPLSFYSAWIYLYEWIITGDGTFNLECLHKVIYGYFYYLDSRRGISASFCPFRCRLLVG